jgi:hypothetical protein
MTSRNAEIAVLQEQMNGQREALSQFKDDTKENFRAVNEKLDSNSDNVDKRLKNIESLLTQAKGGWKLLLFVSGLAATVSAVAGKLLGLFLSLPR